MANKIFGTDFDNDAAPQQTWTLSANNGTVLKDVTLGDILKVMAQLSGETSPVNADTLLLWDASASEVNQVTLANLHKGMAPDGWVASEATWSYSSADSPTFVISVNADMTSLIGVGFRIKLTQTTAKYFIVTAVGSFSGGATLITVYGGTDYTLANAAISSPHYSMAKAPFGFPMSPAKWTVSFSDANSQVQASPTASVWYNVGSMSLTIPIGLWRVYFEAVGVILATPGAATNYGFKVTLSTTNNGETDVEFTARKTSALPAMTGATDRFSFHTEKLVDLAAKAVYYINALTGTAGATSVGVRGDDVPTSVKAICAYL